MKEEMKCPQCGGNKYQASGSENYKCMYCGTVFSIKKEIPLPPPESKPVDSAPANVTVNVNVDDMQRKLIQAQREAMRQEAEEKKEKQINGCFIMAIIGSVFIMILFKGCFD